MAKKPLPDDSQLASLAEELALTLHDGISPADGLSLLGAEEKDADMHRLIDELYSKTDLGEMLAEAMEQSGAFPDYFVNMVRLGETTGRLENTLLALSRYYTHRENMRRSIHNAVMYPSILLVIMLIVVIILITKVLPIFSDVFGQFGATVPGGVQRLMDIGRALGGASGILVGAVIAVAAAMFAASCIPSARKGLSRLFLRGKTGDMINCARFSSAVSMGVSSGLDLDAALALADRLCSDDKMSAKIKSAREKIADGGSFSDAVRDSGIFPPRDSRTLAVAVRTGATDSVLASIAERQESAAQRRIEGIVSVIEPIFVIALSVIVGLILLSVMLPLISIITCIG